MPTYVARILRMKTTSLANVRANFSQYVQDVVTTRERVTVTRNGEPAVVLISADDLESLEEALFWVQHAEPALAGDEDPATFIDHGDLLREQIARAEAAGEHRAAEHLRALLAR